MAEKVEKEKLEKLENLGKGKYILSTILTLVVLTASVYFILNDDVRIDIENTRSVFKVKEDGKWVISGIEYVNLYDGTAKMRAKSRSLVTEIFEQDGINMSKVTRTANYKNDITVIEEYLFNANYSDVELFPVSHSIRVLNAKTAQKEVAKNTEYILEYRVTDLLYYGETNSGVNSPHEFGHNMKVEWEDGNYYSKVERLKNQDKANLIIRYRLSSDDYIKNVRLFDPILDADGVFSELLYNDGGLVNGEAIYLMNSPVDLEVRDLYHTYFLEKGNGISRWEVYIEKNIGYEVPTYEEIETEIEINEINEVSEVSNITGMNETKLVNVTTLVENGTTIEYRPEWVLLDYDDIITKGVHKIRLLGFYEKIGHNKIDWYPNVYLDKDKYSLPRNMYGVIESKDLQQSKWAWWSDSWDYKREITITENSGSSLNNYSILIYVPYSANMKTDFSDLRFTDSTKTEELGYWIENKSDGNYANVWVKVPELTASQNTSIFMYYGNSEAESNSYMGNAFLIADDFNGDNINSTLWNSYATSSASVTQGNGILSLSISSQGSPGTDIWIQNRIATLTSKKNVTGFEPVMIISRMNVSNRGAVSIINDDKKYTKNIGIEGKPYGASLSEVINGQNSIVPKTEYGTFINDQYRTNNFYFYSNKLNLTQVGEYTAIGTTNSNEIYGMVGLIHWYGVGTVQYDDIIVKRYSSIAPTYTIGDEEIAEEMTIAFVTPPTPIDNLNTTQRHIPVEVEIDYLNVEFKNITYNFYKNGVLDQSMFFDTEVTFVNKTNLQNDTWQYNVTVCGETEDESVVCASTPTRTINIYRTPYIYVGGGANQIKKYDGFFNLITEGPSYGPIYVIVTDDNYVYYGGYDGYTYKAYKNNLSTIASSGDFSWKIYSITTDDDYVYYGTGFLGRYVKKVYKGNFTIAASSQLFGGVIYSITLDGDYIYFVENKIIHKAYKSNLSVVVDGPDYGGAINSIVADDDYIYYGGANTQTVRKAYKSNLSTITDSPNYNGEIQDITIDDDYIYYGGANTQTVRKAYKSNLSTITNSPNYGGIINSIVVHDNYVYYGGKTTQVVRKAYKSNLSTITNSPNYGGIINSVAIDPIPTLKFKSMSPIDDFIKTDSNDITFTFNVTDGGSLGIKNVSIVINNTITQTNTSKIVGVYNFQENLDDGYYEWKIIAYDEEYLQMHESELRHLTIDTTPPVINVINPDEDVEIYPNEEIITFKYNIYDEVTNVDTCILEYMNENKTIPCDGTNNANKLGNTTINTAQLTNATTTTFVRIDTINVDQSSPYISNASSELMSSSTSYGKEIRIDIVYNNGTTVSQTNSTTSTSYVLMNFENPNPEESVKEVQFWGRGISTSGTFYSRNRGIRYSEAPFVITYLYPNNNVIFYANDTSGHMGSRNFILTSFINPSVILVSPVDESVGAIGLEYDFIGTASVILSDYTNLSNSTLYLWDNLGDLYYTNTLDIELDDEFPEAAQVSYLYTFDFQGDYPWNILVCDELNACVFAENNYTIEVIPPVITEFTINGQTEGFDVELGASIDLFATINAGNITFDLDSPEYGKDLNNSYLESTFTATIMSFIRKNFTNGVSSVLFQSLVGNIVDYFNVSVNKYDIIDNLYFNISGNTTDNLIIFYKPGEVVEPLMDINKIQAILVGYLNGSNLIAKEVKDITHPDGLIDSKNLSYEIAGDNIMEVPIDYKTGLINILFKMTGGKFGFSFAEVFNNIYYMDIFRTNATVVKGYVKPYGHTPKNFTVDKFDNEINRTIWNIPENGTYSPGMKYTFSSWENPSGLSFRTYLEYISGQDGFTKTNMVEYPYWDYVNAHTPTMIEIGIDSNWTLTTRKYYFSSNNLFDVFNFVQLGGRTVYSNPFPEYCFNRRGDGTFSDCDASGKTNDVIIKLYNNMDGTWTYNLSGVEVVKSYYSDDASGTYCGSITETYNYTKGTWSKVPQTTGYGCPFSSAIIDSPRDFGGVISNLDVLRIDALRFEQETKGFNDKDYGVGLRYTDNLFKIRYINQTLLNLTNSSYYSTEIFDSAGTNITSLNMSADGYFTARFYASADNGENYKLMDIYEFTLLDDPGNKIKYYVDFNVEDGGYMTLSPLITNVRLKTLNTYPSNITINVGDGTVHNKDFKFDGELNTSNSPITVNLPNFSINPDMFSSRDILNIYNLPINVHSETAGIINVSDIEFVYNPNPIHLNSTIIQDYIDEQDYSPLTRGQFNMSMGILAVGNVTLDNLHYEYAGGNYTYNVTARTPNGLVKQIIGINYFFTMWNYMFGPPNINSLEFVPINPTSKNVSAYGQTSTRPIIVLTNYGYHDKNASVMLRISDVENSTSPDESCVNLTVSATNNKSQGIILNTTYQELVNGTKFLDETNLWMWADYDCNYGTWRNWEPNFYIKYCCEGCLCSD